MAKAVLRHYFGGMDLYTIKSYMFPPSLEAAYELLSRDQKNNAILGGCCWLKMGRRRLRTAVDLTQLGLDRIEVRDGCVEIGACVTLRQLETAPELTGRFGGILSRCVEHIVGVQFRNCATVGGSVYSRFGFSDVTAALLALDASVVLYRQGEIPLADFMAMPIHFDDILVKVRVRDDGRTAAYESLRRSTTDLPLLAVGVSRLDNEWIVSVGARPASARRSAEAAACLAAGGTPAEAGEAAARELTFGTDLRAGADYRREMTKVLVRRAAEACGKGGDQA